ncbi:MAG: pilus assembly protein PilP [Myxococcota bacterium]
MRRRHGSGLVLLFVVGLFGCEEEVIQAGGSKSAGSDGEGDSAGQGAVEPVPDAPTLDYDDEVFDEDTLANRDPFRSFVDTFKIEAPETVQRRVIMPDTAVDQMHLVAIIGRVPQPRAMLVDPDGVGHVVKRGDYVGRAEVVEVGGSEGMPVTLNWRVDRIRENEVVLAREDPTDPDQPPLTRTLNLYTEEELARTQIER